LWGKGYLPVPSPTLIKQEDVQEGTTKMTDNNEYFSWDFTDTEGNTQTVTFISAGDIPVGVIDDATLPENQSRANLIIMKEAAKTEDDYAKIRLMKSKDFSELMEAYNKAE
jgi:hypothetical protein